MEQIDIIIGQYPQFADMISTGNTGAWPYTHHILKKIGCESPMSFSTPFSFAGCFAALELDQTFADSILHQFRAGMQIEFLHDILTVWSHGLRADMQLFGNLWVGGSLCQ